MKKSESVIEINKAMVAFRKEVKQPIKDKSNPFFKSKYVPLENVVEAIDEAATPHGLSYTQWALNDNSGRIGVATMLMHESGEYIEYDPVFMNAEKNTPQGAGSLISYLKRYSLSAIFGITSDQDDDGNAASGKNNSPKQQNRTQWASSETIGTLKKEVIAFTNLIKGTDKEAPQNVVEQKFNINDYKLTEKQAADALNKIRNNAKTITGGNNNA
ncbi:single-stranded DNA-binding protein [Staphylococcus muscae]|uniref:Putative phage single-strand DNA binding protein n=2 Tax=Staphylococcus TaxID=1279 RepID=A0A240BZU4_9STAP|nr:ERF family protein [Staphylococcus muscae]AVQ34388.1 single-stranded DNA-binding protein [Staphylococcus muscae]PNZ02516.1 single-stranded DNA-binding protein [Staphylococcus muscae]GGA93458.1 single-stranded DNA-binding protein [Staphylococcus muscae]SNW00573.1 putative phage single-strand DNA binding protein [Staphylococcus muscae]